MRVAFGMGNKLADGIRVGEWVDISGMLDEIRLVKSSEVRTYMRLAAKAADAGTQAAIDAIHDGALESEVAAECLAAMTPAGSTPPGAVELMRVQLMRLELRNIAATTVDTW